ncbi:hypothetical protein MLD38_013829 [Melastoma candidum]|uniref:Uncharacterized protein n=1 Tax=Melastoma candidum TaxID=119954 RepID=A0ACB9RAW3_9MYRT|nr:hypothetical protein MLD38_013829 [Melastoma candidum]
MPPRAAALHYHLRRNHFSTAPPRRPDEPSDLVSTVVSILTNHRSKYRWSQLLSHLGALPPRPPPLEPLTPAEFSQIAIRLTKKPRIALNFFLFTKRHSLTDHTVSSHSALIHVLCKSRLASQSLALIRDSIRAWGELIVFKGLVGTYKECGGSPVVFEFFIKACLDAKKIDGAVKVVRKLVKGGFRVKVPIFNEVISGVCRSRGGLVGYDIYKEFFGDDGDGISDDGRVRAKATVQTFNALMMGFYRDGALDRVVELWDEMKEGNCEPNSRTYNLLIAVYCEDGNMTEAEKIWNEMRLKGILSDVTGYNTMISGYCEIGNTERAEELFREIELSGLNATGVTYGHLIRGYCKSGTADLTLSVFKDMLRKNFRPEASTLQEVVSLLCNSGRVCQALEIIRGVMYNFGLVPKRSSFGILIRGLCLEGKMDEALKLQAEMVGKGYEPDGELYAAFIDGCVKLGDQTLAEKLRKEMADMGCAEIE